MSSEKKSMLVYYIDCGKLDCDAVLEFLETVEEKIKIPEDVCKEGGIIHQIFLPTFGNTRIETIPLG